MKIRNYIQVKTVEAFHEAAKAADGPITILAGGTDVLVNGREDDVYKDCTIIDIFPVEALHGVYETENMLLIGACTTHEAISHDPLVKQYAPILAEACGAVGSLQTRNRATIGGNLANASPAADTMSALAVLHAELVIERDGEARVEPMTAIFTKPYKTNLAQNDLITTIRVPKQSPNVRYDYVKVGRRKVLSISRMTVATLLEMDNNGVVTRFDMTVGATFPRPMLFPDISAMLVGKRPSEQDIIGVAKALSDKIPEIAGIRKSTIYKQPVCRNISERSLRKLFADILK